MTSARATPLRTRPTRFPVSPALGESLPGLVARSVETNVLLRMRVVLDALPGRLLHPASICLEPEDRLRNLASVLGFPPERLAPMVYRYVDPADCRRGGPLRFGDAVLLREDLLLETRRVSPITLGSQDFHMAWWLVGLLPYCPVSLERLVDRCDACGSTLGWRSSRGVGFCERCWNRVAPSAEPPCADTIADDYRRFADLASPEPGRRAAALATLPEPVRTLPAGDLVDMALQLGTLCREEPLIVARKNAKTLAPEILAEVVATGTRMLSTWPDGIDRWVRDAVAAASADLDGLRRLRRIIRRPGLPHTASPERRALYRAALPGMFGSFAEGLGDAATHVNAREANRLTKRGHAALRSLADDGIVGDGLPTARRAVRRYDRTSLEAVARAFEEAEPASRLEWRAALSRPAVEQLCCLGVVREARHPALHRLHPTLHLRREDVEALTARLAALGAADPPPPEARPLSSAMRRFGGGPKPWGAVLKAMLDGSVPCWSAAAGPFALTTLVDPGTLAGLAHPEFDEADFPDFPFSSELNQRDVQDALNADPDEVRALRSLDVLRFVRRGTALMASRAEVGSVARRYVGAAEIGERLGLPRLRVSTGLAARRAPKLALGWRRDWFERREADVRRWLA